MEIAEDEDPFKLEELTSYTEVIALRNTLRDSEMEQEPLKEKKKRGEKNYDEDASKKVKGARVKNDIKACAVHLVDIHPKNSARAVALSLKMEPRTVQR